jgi:hypothetical protein
MFKSINRHSLPRWSAFLVAAATGISCAPADGGVAEEVSYNVGKHKLVLKQDEMPDQVLLDGKVVIEHDIVTVDKQVTIGDVPVLIGEAGMSGNACSPLMFLIEFPRGKRPKVHKEIGNCSSVWLRVEESSVHFTTTEFPGIPGMHVMWTPTTGLRKMPDVVYKPDPKKDWDSVLSNPTPRVVELFDIPSVASLLYRLIRGHKDDVMRIVNGWDAEGRIWANHYIGESCHSHYCDVSRMLVILDLKKRHAFVAWTKADREEVVVRPAMSAWTPVAKQELDQWKARAREQ